jgi:hypothetical protein
MRNPLWVEVTATAPRMRQIEQVHRLAEASPKGNSAVKPTAPQWQAPLRVMRSVEDVSTSQLLWATLDRDGSAQRKQPKGQ